MNSSIPFKEQLQNQINKMERSKTIRKSTLNTLERKTIYNHLNTLYLENDNPIYMNIEELKKNNVSKDIETQTEPLNISNPPIIYKNNKSILCISTCITILLIAANTIIFHYTHFI